MFSVGISDHIMIARSSADPFFGPAQRLHGATYCVELEVRATSLGKNDVLMDIAALRSVLRRVLDELDYTNLDECLVQNHSSTTERLAEYLGHRVAQELARLPPDHAPPSPASLSLRLRESPVAWASFERVV